MPPMQHRMRAALFLVCMLFSGEIYRQCLLRLAPIDSLTYTRASPSNVSLVAASIRIAASAPRYHLSQSSPLITACTPSSSFGMADRRAPYKRVRLPSASSSASSNASRTTAASLRPAFALGDTIWKRARLSRPRARRAVSPHPAGPNHPARRLRHLSAPPTPHPQEFDVQRPSISDDRQPSPPLGPQAPADDHPPADQVISSTPASDSPQLRLSPSLASTARSPASLRPFVPTDADSRRSPPPRPSSESSQSWVPPSLSGDEHPFAQNILDNDPNGSLFWEDPTPAQPHPPLDLDPLHRAEIEAACLELESLVREEQLILDHLDDELKLKHNRKSRRKLQGKVDHVQNRIRTCFHEIARLTSLHHCPHLLPAPPLACALDPRPPSRASSTSTLPQPTPDARPLHPIFATPRLPPRGAPPPTRPLPPPSSLGIPSASPRTTSHVEAEVTIVTDPNDKSSASDVDLPSDPNDPNPAPASVLPPPRRRSTSRRRRPATPPAQTRITSFFRPPPPPQPPRSPSMSIQGVNPGFVPPNLAQPQVAPLASSGAPASFVTSANRQDGKAPTFNGTSEKGSLKAQQFLQAWETWVATNHWSDEEKFMYFPSYISGYAREWFGSALVQKLDSMELLRPRDWEHFKELFLAEFDIDQREEVRMQQFASCTQKPGETVKMFRTRCATASSNMTRGMRPWATVLAPVSVPITLMNGSQATGQGMSDRAWRDLFGDDYEAKLTHQHGLGFPHLFNFLSVHFQTALSRQFKHDKREAHRLLNRMMICSGATPALRTEALQSKIVDEDEWIDHLTTVELSSKGKAAASSASNAAVSADQEELIQAAESVIAAVKAAQPKRGSRAGRGRNSNNSSKGSRNQSKPQQQQQPQQQQPVDHHPPPPPPLPQQPAGGRSRTVTRACMFCESMDHYVRDCPYRNECLALCKSHIDRHPRPSIAALSGAPPGFQQLQRQQQLAAYYPPVHMATPPPPQQHQIQPQQPRQHSLLPYDTSPQVGAISAFAPAPFLNTANNNAPATVNHSPYEEALAQSLARMPYDLAAATAANQSTSGNA